LRIAVWIVGAAIVVWALLDPGLRRSDAALLSLACFPLASGIALIVAAAGWGRRWQATAWWFALAIVGHAATLQWIEAGPQVRYQHYVFPPHLPVSMRLLVPAVLIGQTLAVASGVRRFVPGIRDWLTRNYSWWRIGLMLLAFVGTSAALSRGLAQFGRELIFASFVQTIQLANIVLVAASVPAESLDSIRKRVVGWLGDPGVAGRASTPGWRGLLWVAAAWVLVASGSLAWFSYEAHPHIPDEVAYLLQARYMAEGMLSMPCPPVPGGFELDLMTCDADGWYSIFPPGWPAMLALGVLTGLPWLVNPLLGALAILLAGRFYRELYDRHTSLSAALLLAASPWFVLMSMSFMAHTFTLVCALVAATAVARLRKEPRVHLAVAGGLATGVVGLIRPMDGLILAALLGLWSLGARGPRFRLWPSLLYGAATAVGGVLCLAYNRHLSGAIGTHPIMEFFDARYGVGANALGFGPNRGLGWTGLDPLPGHGPFDVLINGALNAFAINVELLGWSTGSLLILLLFLFSPVRKRRDAPMFAVVAVVIGLHSFYWFNGGPDFGARYWYLVIVPCAAFAARGLVFLAVSSRATGRPAEHRKIRVLVAVFGLCLSTLVCFMPWRAVDKYHHYRGMRPEVRRLARVHGFGNSLVLVRGPRHPDYASAAVYNPVDLDSEAPIFAWDRDPQVRERLLREYSTRPVWILQGPTATGAEYRVIAGPLPPGSAPAALDASDR